MADLFDIVIVGCGPVGAVAAHLCGQGGLKTLVLEREAAPHLLQRAVHLDHEMMRIFQQLGLVDRLLPLMRVTHGHVHIGANGGVGAQREPPVWMKPGDVVDVDIPGVGLLRNTIGQEG